MSGTGKKKRIIAALVSAGLLLGITTVAYAKTYLPTGRDTKLPPDKVTYDIVKLDAYQLLYETDTMRYYYREDRDIIAVEDKRSGYVWKTGADVAFSADLTAAVKAAQTTEEKAAVAEPKEASMNATYVGIANSLVTVEYYESDTVKNISSASKDGASSKLVMLNDNPATRRLDVDFSAIDLQMKVYITFLEDSIRYEIPYEEISGAGKSRMASVLLTPFLGASGGEAAFWDPETGEYGENQKKYMVPGYVLVPDGCGGLIRFADNAVSFTEYIGDVYGPDLSTEPYYTTSRNDAVPLKNPVMPVFGIAHGDSQAAFVAYAESGAEYMEIIVRPDENKKVKYTWGYPRFEYNLSYFQVYNKQGAGYFSMMAEPQHVDVSMTYTLTRPDKVKYSGKIGSSGDFKDLFSKYEKQGIDISYSREMATINREMTGYYNTAAKHVNTWYVEVDESMILPQNVPVANFSRATPKKVAAWTKTLAEKLEKTSASITLDGISNILTGTYDRDGVDFSITEAIALYQDTLAGVKNDLKVNLVNPNMYLWKYTDRFLQMPAGTSQYVFETDTVPFLQLVLHGTMEMYAPYSNFSFYAQSDILKMIDYNMSPSFILSKEPSYYLADTVSSDLYSTEFAQYEALIGSIYNSVNKVLSKVSGYEWTDRTVLEDGVILNTYQNGQDMKYVVINYTDHTVSWQGNEIGGLSAEVISGEGVR